MFQRLVLGAMAVAGATAAELRPVSNFGDNPTNIEMYEYVPDSLAESPAIIVNMHGCGGQAPGWFQNNAQLTSYADQLGFVLIYPGTPNQMNCWDVHNADSLTHGQGGDALGITNMVNYALSEYNGDAARVFAMGSSSGAMMTNVLAGSYPDVFEAGSAYSGTAHACSAGSPGSTPMESNQTCAQGLEHTPDEWANFVYNSFPEYDGARPRMQIWHGNADTLVVPQCASEAVKQWSAVHGVELSEEVPGEPSGEYTKSVYGDGTQLVAYFGEGVGHTAPVNAELTLRFFGLLE